MLRGHAFRCHVGDNGGGGDGGGGDGGVGGGESAGAVMAAQPQAPHLLVHDQLPMLPPPSFAHCLQHLSLVCHDGLALPLQPKVGSLGQTSPCESSRPRYGSSASPAAGDWGRMPAPKTAGSQCGGQATPEATLEATPEEPSTMLLRRSTLITAPTRAKARRTMCAVCVVCVYECEWKEEVLQICTPCNRPGRIQLLGRTVFCDKVECIRSQLSEKHGCPRVVFLHAGCTKGGRPTTQSMPYTRV